MTTNTQSPYLRGDGVAAAYVGMKDPQGRAFRVWADANFLTYSVIGKGIVRTYRKADIDRLYLATAHNVPAQIKVA